MMQYNRILECVPNFSEGRNKATIDEICKAISDVDGVKLLHVDMGYAANRTVITFAGIPEQVVEAAFQASKVASLKINMASHTGVHPRLGAVDVLPLIPVKGITMDEVIKASYVLAQRIGNELNIPIYCYERSAKTSQRANLEAIRKGEYEGLGQKMQLPEGIPDYGPTTMNVVSGATVLGARNFLVAYNINLASPSVEIATKIAQRVRESGSFVTNSNGQKHRIPGMLKATKAIGWYIDEYNIAQVSLNLTDIDRTPMHLAYETVKAIAGTYNVAVTGSELIGLVPEKALVDAGNYYANGLVLGRDALIDLAVKSLGLSDINTFDVRKRIIEDLLAAS